MTPSLQLTPQEAERIRQILGAYEAQNPQRIKEFDLANPPTPPYRFQEFPKVMYHHETGRHKQAENAQQQAEAEAAGWVTESIPVEEADIPVEISADEAALINAAETSKQPAKRGSPAKVQPAT